MDDARPPVMGDLLKINEHLMIYCGGHDCRRQVRLTAVEAVELLGFHTTMAQAERRLNCSACGRRGRDRFISVRGCSIDVTAWNARQAQATAAARGERLSWDLEQHLNSLRRLLGGEGLGGDGPVQWPVKEPSKDV